MPWRASRASSSPPRDERRSARSRVPRASAGNRRALQYRRGRAAVAVAALALVAAVVAASCGGPTNPTVRPSSNAPANYTFILANPVGLMALDAKGQIIGQIGSLPVDSSPTQPTLSPDRKTIAFSITLAPTGSTATFGSDIWTMALDGTNVQKVLEHERENVFYTAPQFDPGGKALYVQRRAA